MARVYAAALIGAFGMSIAGLLVTSTLLQPFSGDLTRIGGLLESDFGWTLPQRRFRRSHYLLAEEVPQDGAAWDIVVFGDSFTDNTREIASWLEFVLAETGGTAVAVGYKSPEQVLGYLSSPQYLRAPPEALILQSVTRSMAYRAAQPGCVEPAPARDRDFQRTALGALSTAPTGIAAEVYLRRLRFTGVLERLNVSAYFLRQRAKYSLAPPLSPVRSYAIGRHDLFSSRIANQVLYYVADADAQRVPPRQVNEFSCTLRAFREAATANAYTRFLFVPAPDKSVVYAPYATEQVRATPDGYEAAKDTLAADFVDTLDRLRAAIATGAKDVYLPNDSHWGSMGGEIVGKAVLDHLMGIAEPSAVSEPTQSQ